MQGGAKVGTVSLSPTGMSVYSLELTVPEFLLHLIIMEVGCLLLRCPGFRRRALKVLCYCQWRLTLPKAHRVLGLVVSALCE